MATLPQIAGSRATVGWPTFLVHRGRMYALQDYRSGTTGVEYLILAPSDRSVHFQMRVQIVDGGESFLYDAVTNITNNGTALSALNMNNNYGESYTTGLYLNPTYDSVSDLEWTHIVAKNTASDGYGFTGFERVMAPNDKFLLRITPSVSSDVTVQIDFYESENHL